MAFVIILRNDQALEQEGSLVQRGRFVHRGVGIGDKALPAVSNTCIPMMYDSVSSYQLLRRL